MSTGGNEYSARVGRLQELMKSEGAGHLAVFGNRWRNGFLRYLSGYRPPGAHMTLMVMMLVPADGKLMMCVTPESVAEQIQSLPISCDVKVYKNFSDDCTELLKDVCKEDRKIGIAGDLKKPYAGMPHSFVEKLLKIKKGLEIVDFSGMINKLRMIKSSGEIETYRRNSEVAQAGWDAILEHTHPGAIENEVWAHHWHAMEGMGADDAHSVLVRGRDGMMWIRPPISDGIKKGEVVNWEITPTRDDYFFQINRMACVGGDPRRYRDVFEVISQALDSAIDEIHPGADSADVANAALGVIESSDVATTLPYFRVGHGTGTSLDEEPYIHFNTDITLQENMVFVIHPVAFLPHWKGSVQMLGDMVRVTSKGAERMSQLEDELPVLRGSG